MPKKKEKIDLGPLPDINTMKAADVMRALDEAEKEAREANKAADRAKARKSAIKALALTKLEMEELESASARMPDGKRVIYTPYPFVTFYVDNMDEFKAWAAEQDESYFDSSPKLREQVLIDEARRREQDGEPLPPGVKRYEETRISRSAQGK